MIRTILFLIATLVALPFFVYYYDQPVTGEIYEGMIIAVYIMLGIAGTCFVVSELTRNYSQVDKIWSIAPIIYTWYIAIDAEYNLRLVIMASLVTIWGLRLTYNFSRRGGYSWKFWTGEEDYRWAILRQQPHLKAPWKWTLFNLFFISLYQNSLILLFTLPIVVAWQGADTPINWLDLLAGGLMLTFIILETIADQQQYDYQEEKYRRKREGLPLDSPYDKGFIDSGLWKYVRHPNYASEQAIWICFYLFSVAATGRWVNWSIAGCILLILLFLGSSDFSEKITAGKYPGYKKYQDSVPRFIPFLKKR
jgi:steroid 5-alpha reductase family enzyme